MARSRSPRFFAWLVVVAMVWLFGAPWANAARDPVGGLGAVGGPQGGPALDAAVTLVIDFEEVPGAGNPEFTSLETDGYTFTSTHAHVVGDPEFCLFGGCVAPPTYIAEEEGGLGGPITMIRNQGRRFQLLEIDGAQLFNDDEGADSGGFPNATVLRVVAEVAGGGTVIADFSLPDTGFGTFFLPLTSCGHTACRLTSVTFSGLTKSGDPGGFAVDNITVRQP